MFKNAGLLEQDRLTVRGEPDPFFAWSRERFVRAVRVTRIGRVHVSEHQFGSGAGEIIFKFRGDQRSPAGLGVQFIELTFWSGAKYLAHSDCPDAPRNARERDVFDIESAIEKERESRAELIDWNFARGEHFRVSESIRKRVSGLLHRRRTGFANVIAANRDRVPTRHFTGGELHHVGEKSQRWFNREDRLVLRLDFLENVGLNRPA